MKKIMKRNSRKSNFYSYAIVTLISILCYLNSLYGDFVHDDIPAILRNPDVLGQTTLLEVFKNDFWGTPMSDANSHKSYRPLTVLTFRLTNWFFGMKCYWFHVGNILLHTICCILFTRIALNVSRLEQTFATIAGALFASHPIHTEAVTGIVGRADVLACLLFSLSFITYHGHKGPITGNRIIFSCILAAVSMLAKETGLTVLLVNIGYDLYKSSVYIKKSIVNKQWNEETASLWKRISKVGLTILVLVAFRLAMLQGTLPKFSDQDNPTAFHPSQTVRIMTYSYLAVLHFWLILFPYTLSHDWQLGSVPLVINITDSRNMYTIVFVTAAVCLVYKFLCDLEHQRQPVVILGTLLAVLPFLPASNLLVTVGFVVAERILYISSMGIILLTVYGGQLMLNKASYSSTQKHSFIYIVFMLIICFFIARTTIRNQDWMTRETLLRSGINTLPNNAKMHYNLANFLRESQDYELSIRHYTEALRLWPSYASAYNNLGTLMESLNEAEAHFLAAIYYSPNHVNAHCNLGQVYRKMNRTEEAISMLMTCLKLNPNYVGAYMLMENLYDNGQPAGTLLKHLTKFKLQTHNPHYFFAYYAQWLHKKYRIAEAIHHYKKALHLSQNHRFTILGLAKAYRARGYLARFHQVQTRLYTNNKWPRNRDPRQNKEPNSLQIWDEYKHSQATLSQDNQLYMDYVALCNKLEIRPILLSTVVNGMKTMHTFSELEAAKESSTVVGPGCR